MIKEDAEKERIFREYDVLVWDEQDYYYVVRHKKTGKQYVLESSLRGYKFRESTVDWSDTHYIKERIPGTRRYETTISSKKCKHKKKNKA